MADGLLSLSLVFLFAVPLTAHTRMMAGIKQADEGRVNDRLKAIIRSNFLLTSGIICFASGGLVVMTTLLIIANGEVVDPSIEHYQIWALTVPACTTCLAIVLTHSLTVSWMPRRVRTAFQRSEFSFHDLDDMLSRSKGQQDQSGVAESNRAGNRNNADTDASRELLFLGNIHGDNEKIETQIRVRKYYVPFDTMLSRWIGIQKAQRLSQFCLDNKLSWQILLTTFFVALIALVILVLLGLVPSWVSFIILVGIMLAQLADNYLSLPVVRVLLKLGEVRARLIFHLVFALFFCDVLNWDARCALSTSVFLGYFYMIFVDALVKESRLAFSWIIAILTPCLSISLLVLLQWDFIPDSKNTTILFIGMQSNTTTPYNLAPTPYTYSLYLLTRDLCVVVTLLAIKDGVVILRRQRRNWFIRIKGDIAVKVAGLPVADHSKSTRHVATPRATENKQQSSKAESSSPSKKVDVVEATFTGDSDQDKPVPSQQLEATAEAIAPQASLSVSQANDSSEGSGKKKLIDTIELRESDSLCILLLGLNYGSRALDIFTQPWFRLLNEYLVALPITIYVTLVLPGFVDSRVSYLLLLTLIPFSRNFGLKSLRLLYLITLRDFAFLTEFCLATSAAILLGLSFTDQPKRLLSYHLILTYIDMRTWDARCVLFHTGTRKGRRLSPVERFLFRLASFLVLCSNMGLIPLLFLGIPANADFFRQFSFVPKTYYPATLNAVLFYEDGSNILSLFIFKMAYDMYSNMLVRGRGIKFRYIRAPLVPTFEELDQNSNDGRSEKSGSVVNLNLNLKNVVGHLSPSDGPKGDGNGEGSSYQDKSIGTFTSVTGTDSKKQKRKKSNKVMSDGSGVDYNEVHTAQSGNAPSVSELSSSHPLG